MWTMQDSKELPEGIAAAAAAQFGEQILATHHSGCNLINTCGTY